MTTYRHTITLDDGQRIALEAALHIMIKHCDDQMLEGPKAPFWAHRKSCREIMSKLLGSTPAITSTSYFS